MSQSQEKWEYAAGYVGAEIGHFIRFSKHEDGVLIGIGEQAESNARLIAVALEMKSALKEASEYLHDNKLNSIGSCSQLHKLFDRIIESVTKETIEKMLK